MNTQDEMRKPLKDMTVAELHMLILGVAMTGDDRYALERAISIATVLHCDDYRQEPVVSSTGRIREKSTAYIHHPLRNTARLVRWGVTDIDIIVASLLHDTVEDHAQEYASFYCSVPEVSEESARAIAFSYIATIFGERVERIVRNMSNDIIDRETTTAAQRRALYVEHVTEVVFDDVDTFLAKFSDFCDNALSLHFNATSKSRSYFASRYLPLAPVFKSALETHRDALIGFSPTRNPFVTALVSSQGFTDIERKINGAEAYLRALIVH